MKYRFEHNPQTLSGEFFLSADIVEDKELCEAHTEIEERNISENIGALIVSTLAVKEVFYVYNSTTELKQFKTKLTEEQEVERGFSFVGEKHQYSFCIMPPDKRGGV